MPVAASVERERRQIGVQDLGIVDAARAPPVPARSTADNRRLGPAVQRGRPAGRRWPATPAPSPAGSCPVRAENRGTRDSPLSTTTRTPSIVRLVSAMDVARITLRRFRSSGRRARSCCSGVRLPWSGDDRRHMLPASMFLRRAGFHRRRAGTRARRPRRGPARRRWRAPPGPRFVRPLLSARSGSRRGSSGPHSSPPVRLPAAGSRAGRRAWPT